MSKPDISVIVTNYNHGQYIEEAVESILYQTLADYEVIIVDDCSTDNSKDVIENIVKLDDRIQKPIYLPRNSGKWFALNTAIATARAPLITLQDADDCSVPARLQRQFEALKTFNSLHNLSGFVHCYNEKDMAEGKLWRPNKLGYDVMDHEEVVKTVLKGYRTPGINHYFVGNDYEVHGASSMFYKQLWEFGLRFNPNGLGLMIKAAGEDSDHNLRMTLTIQKTSVLKEPLYLYRRNTTTNPSYTRGL